MMSTATTLGVSLLSGPWTPRRPPGLALWLDASDASTLFQNSNGTTAATADANPVGYWGDKSGNGRHGTQSTAGSRPLLKTGIQNGKNVLRLDGTDDFLTLGDHLDNPTALTVFCVVAGAAGGSASGSIISRYNGGGGAGWAVYGKGRYAHFQTDGSNYCLWDTGAAYDDSVFRLFTTTWDGSAIAQRVNGAITGSQSNVGTYTGCSNAMPLAGGALVTPPAYFLAGDVGEIIVYNSVLSATNRLAVEAYLRAKWATA